MGTAPLLFRTSTFTQVNILHGNVRKSSAAILEKETELSTGFRVRDVSQDPVAATRALQFRSQIAQGKQYQRNIGMARSELTAIEDALSDASRIVTRAREIVLRESNSSVAGTRANAAEEVAQLIEEAVEVVNRRFQEKYLFAGDDGSRPPAEIVGGLVNFTGSTTTTPVTISQGVSVDRDVSSLDAFGAISSEIRGRVDLDPSLTASTKLADLNGGDGVASGSIRVQDGLGNEETLDLSGAETVGDVLAVINANGIVQASINAAGDGVLLTEATGTGDVTVSEVNNGKTANSLGILRTSPGGGDTLTGSDLDPRIRLTTSLSDVFDLTANPDILDGITVSNDLVTKTISFSTADTIEDVLNAINSAEAYVVASLNEDGTGINIRSTLSGSRFTISENGGSSAQSFGWLVDFVDLPLEHLNNGFGILPRDGTDFSITMKDGTVLDVDISSAETVQDVLDLINNHPDNNGDLTASVPAGQNRIELEDVNSGGATGDLGVEAVNGSFAAQNLGIDKTVADPGDTLTGDDLNPAGFEVDSMFSALIALRVALLEDNDSKLEQILPMLETSEDRVVNVQGEVGARVSRLNLAESRLADQAIRLQALVSEEIEVDLAESVLEFEKQRNILEASLSITGRILGLSLLDFLR